MLTLLRASEKDFDRITAFYKNVVENNETVPYYSRWIYGLHPSDELIAGYLRDGDVYYSERDGIILSAAAVVHSQDEAYHKVAWEKDLADDEVATVHVLAVSPAHTRRGIAKETMQAVEEMARSAGKKAIRLDALSTNPPALRLYESLGFSRRGVCRWYASNLGYADFILYEKELKTYE